MAVNVVNFASIDAKLRRAMAHREALRHIVDDRTGEPRYQVPLRADLNVDYGFHIFTIAALPNFDDLTEEISVCTGDFIHNLRSALDHFGWQLACSAAGGTPTSPRKVQLPICTGVNGQGNTEHKKPPYFADADWARVHEWQPCKGVNGRPDHWTGDYVHPLTLMHDMWNMDKHRALPVVLLTSNQFSTVPTRSGHPPWLIRTADGWATDFSRLREPDPLADEMSFDHAEPLVEVGAEVVRIRMTSPFRNEPKIEHAGYVKPQVALNDLRPLLPTLDRLMAFVVSMLQEWR